MKLNLILTGATGMVGEGVLQECLDNSTIEKVLVIGRKSCTVAHEKLTEIIHKDFMDISPLAEKLSGYNACFFCLGMTSVGIGKDDYYNLTYHLTLNFAKVVSEKNPELTFCYISGAGTDSSEKSSMHWARVKGKTENDLMKLPFKKVYAFRPGFLKPFKGAKNVLKYYKYLSWLIPILKTMKKATTIRELALAMINSVIKGYEKQVIEVPDILKLSKNE